MKKGVILFFVFVLASSFFSFAQDKVDADVAAAYRKYKSGKRLSPEEEYYLAEVYLEEYFGERFNPQKYWDLINSAAKRGFEDAQDEIDEGWIYRSLADAYFFRDDFERTRYYAQKAINKSGSFKCTEGLGFICAAHAADARFTKKYIKAHEYAVLGTELGNAEATAELALCFGYGYGVPKDVDKAYALMETARDMDLSLFVRGTYDDHEDYIRAYDAFERQVNNNRLSKIQVSQKKSQNEFCRSASSNSSSNFKAILVIGSVIAGIAAICDALDTSKSSSSLSSSISSSSSSTSSSSAKSTESYIPSWWVKARHCRNLGNCDFIEDETAHKCGRCGYLIEGEWGDHIIFDGYVCVHHKRNGFLDLMHMQDALYVQTSNNTTMELLEAQLHLQ